jgi:uncharacterized membrane protein YGL010W
MLAGRDCESWLAEYAQSHQHPLSRLTHTFGIPMILVSAIGVSGGVALMGGEGAGQGLTITGRARAGRDRIS